MSSLDDYGYDRGEELYSYGAEVINAVGYDVDDELEVHATLVFGEHGLARLYIFESVADEGGWAHRRRYAYHITYGEEFVARYDRDPFVHPDMPEHKHLPPDERRVPWDRVTLQEVVDEVWAYVQARESAQ